MRRFTALPSGRTPYRQAAHVLIPARVLFTQVGNMIFALAGDRLHIGFVNDHQYQHRKPPPPPRDEGLSDRERRCVELAKLSTLQICERLGLTEGVVRYSFRTAALKLGTTTVRADVLAAAVRRGDVASAVG